MLVMNSLKTVFLISLITTLTFSDSLSTNTLPAENANNVIIIGIDTIPEEPEPDVELPFKVIVTDTDSSGTDSLSIASRETITPQEIADMAAGAHHAKRVQIAGGLCTYTAVGLSTFYFNSLISSDTGPLLPASMTFLSVGGAVMSHISLNVSSKRAVVVSEYLRDKTIINLASKSRRVYRLGIIPAAVSAGFSTVAGIVTTVESRESFGNFFYIPAFGALIIRDILWHKSSNSALEVFKQALHASSDEYKPLEQEKKVRVSLSPQLNVKKRAGGLVMNIAF